MIIGAGFSGLYQLHCLRDRLGLSVQVLEAGGRRRRHLVLEPLSGRALRFRKPFLLLLLLDTELMQEWEWTERYPEQPEILRYLNYVADRFDLRRDIRFDTASPRRAIDEARQPLDRHAPRPARLCRRAS